MLTHRSLLDGSLEGTNGFLSARLATECFAKVRNIKIKGPSVFIFLNSLAHQAWEPI
jgi:hypothetical protein